MMPTRFGSAMPCATRYFDAPGDVVLHLVAPLLVAGVQELLAVAGRAAEVRLQHGVAAVGEELREAVVAPGVAAPTGRRAARRSAAGSSPGRPSAASGTRGSRGRRTTGSGSASSAPARSRGMRSRILYWSVSFFVVRSNRYVSPGSMSLEAVISHSRSSAVRRAEADLLARQLRPEQLVVGLERLVVEVDARAVVLVHGRHQLVGRSEKIAPPKSTRFSGSDSTSSSLAGVRVEQHQAHQIDARPCSSPGRRACRPCGSASGPHVSKTVQV